ncbi:hypothetical protein EAI_03958 [Harpegnathos saltator]|uniref:Myb/SANT-like DNA-binding domain-containing protein n=1 Tax=Harpegnathos saltator TaxID=610380 RepID=E2C9P9_HARSA|nr:hypothetical protein EAI_03958 [Harpegnathos saltator]
MTSPEDAVKATNDADIDANKVDNDLENLSGDNFKWSNEAVLLLLEQYRQYEKDMYSGKITHKKTWEKISQVMNEKEYVVTGRQCSTRFNTMKRTYKGVKDHNKKSGNNKRTWPYFEIMDSLLEAKPYMAPLFTLSLTAASSIATENPVRCSSSCCNSSTSSTMDLDNNVPRPVAALRTPAVNQDDRSVVELTQATWTQADVALRFKITSQLSGAILCSV